MRQALMWHKEQGDSLGGIAEIRMTGIPAGIGEPVFGKVKAELAHAFATIGAVAGVMFGSTREELELPGSEFHEESAPGLAKRSYGIQGGLTTGEPIVMRVFVKPPSTVGEAARKGRHDPCIVPRLIPVLEAMSSFVLADLYVGTRLDRI
jgi:chorismate synthase